MKAEKIHKTIWKYYEQIEKDQAELKGLEAQKVEALVADALGEGEGDSAIDKKFNELARSIYDRKPIIAGLCTRHRAAIREDLAAEAEKHRRDNAKVGAALEDLDRRYRESLGQTMNLQLELEAMNSRFFDSTRQTPRAPLRVLEGTVPEVLKQAQTNVSVGVNPLSLKEKLEFLERQRQAEGFTEPGVAGTNAIIRADGKIYMPCLGRVKITFDPNTGLVTDSHILSTMAIEARSVPDDAGKAIWVPVDGAEPVSPHDLEDHASMDKEYLTVHRAVTPPIPIMPDPLNVRR